MNGEGAKEYNKGVNGEEKRKYIYLLLLLLLLLLPLLPFLFLSFLLLLFLSCGDSYQNHIHKAPRPSESS